MTKSIISALALSTLAAPAAVTLSFDSDLEGFTLQGDVTALEWSAVNGGSMRMEDAGGWGGNGAQLEITSNAAMWAELQLAVINGGTISYDFTVVNSDQEYTAPPNWFETVLIGNSGGTGGWDQEVINSGIGGGSWPVDGTFNVSIPIQPTAGGSVGADGEFFVDLADRWANIHMGLNNEGASMSKAVVYFDNITISAVPEPSTLLLGGLSLAALLRRRRS